MSAWVKVPDGSRWNLDQVKCVLRVPSGSGYNLRAVFADSLYKDIQGYPTEAAVEAASAALLSGGPVPAPF